MVSNVGIPLPVELSVDAIPLELYIYIEADRNDVTLITPYQRRWAMRKDEDSNRIEMSNIERVMIVILAVHDL